MEWLPELADLVVRVFQIFAGSILIYGAHLVLLQPPVSPGATRELVRKSKARRRERDDTGPREEIWSELARVRFRRARYTQFAG
jgi:hypothetical protein